MLAWPPGLAIGVGGGKFFGRRDKSKFSGIPQVKSQGHLDSQAGPP